MGTRVHVDEHAFCREALRAVRRQGIAVIEVAHLLRIECNSLFTAIELRGDLSGVNTLDRGQVPVSNAERARKGCELNPVPAGEISSYLLISSYAVETFRVIDYVLAVFTHDRDAVFFRVNARHFGVASQLDNQLLAADAVMENLALVVIAAQRRSAPVSSERGIRVGR